MCSKKQVCISIIVCYPKLAHPHTSKLHAIYVSDAERKASAMQKKASKLDRQIQKDYQRVVSEVEVIEESKSRARVILTLQ